GVDEGEEGIDDGGGGGGAAREPAVHLVDRRQRGRRRRHAGRNLLQSECKFNTGCGKPRPAGGGGAGRRLAIRPAACPAAEHRRSESSRGRSGWSASRSASGGSGSTASGTTRPGSRSPPVSRAPGRPCSPSASRRSCGAS